MSIIPMILKRISLKFLLIVFGSVICCMPAFSKENKNAHDRLQRVFSHPGDSVQTSVYWYWLSGNVTADGVRKDLEAMKRAGINRAFIGNIGLGDLHTPFTPVELFTPEWWDVMHAALRKASELDIEIGIFNCPGWSQAGGPWIEDSQAMRYLTSVKRTVKGGGRRSIILPRPSDDFQDAKVIAFPTPDGRMAKNCAIDVQGMVGAPEALIDGDRSTEVYFDNSGKANISIPLEDNFTIRSVTFYPVHHGLSANVNITSKNADGAVKALSSFNIDRTNPNVEVGFNPYAPVAVTVPATTGGVIEINIEGAQEGSGLCEIDLSETPTVERYPEKSLAKMFQTPLPYWHEYQWREQPDATESVYTVNSDDVVDLTSKFSGDTLIWDAPDGDWTVMRMGMRPTGIQNGPAAPEGTGHEVDKMTDAYLQHHFDAFIGEILKRIPAEDRRTFKVVVADSYEKGGQNFTDTFIEDFKGRYGYDPLPFLPVYEGVVVGNRDLSDRFLWDVRRFVADRLAYSHIGGLREIAHKHGLRLWLENYGHWGFPGEFLQYGGQSDEVSGEFWSEGTLGDIENRAASSCAHIYGKKKVSAESFTAADMEFYRYPAIIKPRGDRFFSEGINNSLLHVYISQPDDSKPGLNAWFGTEFNRNNTWFSQMDLFTSYLKRCNMMLQQGINVADVAYFIGEDAPKMTGVTDPDLPRGYQFDYINADVILNRLTVENGKWALPDGTTYSILVLPKLETMRPEVIQKLRSLTYEGGILMGEPPHRSPSMENYPNSDQIVKTVASEIWGLSGGGDDARKKSFGRGTVYSGMSLEEAMADMELLPDFKVSDNVPVMYNHRNDGDRQIYYLTNQSGERQVFDATFRVAGLQPELWLPVDGSMRILPEYQDDGCQTIVPMALEPNESVFVVFSENRDRDSRHRNAQDAKNFPDPIEIVNLDASVWHVGFEKGMRGPAERLEIKSPRNLAGYENDSIRYFSGSIDYITEFNLAGKDIKSGSIFVNTGKIGVMGKVYVNGKYAGGVWTDPYRVNITPYIKRGKNTLRIEVVNTWVNRLIGDSSLPKDERGTWTLQNPWNPSSELQPSGILETVKIEKIALCK